MFSCNNTNDNIKCNGRKSCICKKMHAIEMIRSNDTVNAGCTISLLLVKSTEPPRGLDTRSSAKLCGGGDPTDRGGQWHTGVQRHHPHRSANPWGACVRWVGVAVFVCHCWVVNSLHNLLVLVKGSSHGFRDEPLSGGSVWLLFYLWFCGCSSCSIYSELVLV